MKRAVLVVLISGLGAGTARAGTVTLDGTVGPRGSILPDVTQTFAIDASVGTVRGNSLFHSFGQFNLNNGETASFTGPANIHNILARVTGGAASTIDGTIDSTAMPNANLFFINPFGVIFGPHALINVSGSCAVTTADYVKLADGGRFDARHPANDILTAAPVAAFGFLGPTAAPITMTTVQTDPNNPSFQAFLPDGRSIWVIGGDILCDGYVLGAPGGEIVMVSVAAAGELAVDVDNARATVDTTSFAALGDLTIRGGGGAFATGSPGGQVVFEANRIAMSEGSGALADNFGDTPAGGVELRARASIAVMSGTGINAATLGAGHGGDVVLTAPAITLTGANILTTTVGDPAATGHAGDIRITAGEVTVSGDTGIGVSSGPFGAGGNLFVTADRVRVAGALLTGTSFGAPAGNITIQAGTMQMLADAKIASDSTAAGAPGGDIRLSAQTLTMDGRHTQFFTGLSSRCVEDGSGGGNIVVAVGQLELHNGAQISATSENASPGGAVSVHGTDLVVDSGSSIAAGATGSGPAGSVTLQLTGSLLLHSGGLLSVSAAQSTAGDLNVRAGSAMQLNQAEITAQAAGDGGNVHLSAPALVYLLNDQITAHSAHGNGGNVAIGSQFVILNNSQINTSAGVNGGNITIAASFALASPTLAQSLVFTGQQGINGTVTITAPALDLSGNLVVLPGELLQAEHQLQPQCAVRLPGGASSFVVVGTGGAPLEPDNLLPALAAPGLPHER